MPELLRMPSVAADSTEAVLSSWTVPVNVPFKAGEPIAVIETAKAAVDLEAERDGVLLDLLASEGETVQVGAPIAVFGQPGEQADDVAATIAQPPPQEAEPPPQQAEPSPRQAEPSPRQAEPSPRQAEPSPQQAEPPPQRQVYGLSAAIATETPYTRVFASPLARRLAREAGLALEEITGSGPNGRVTGRDVRGVAADRRDTGEPPTRLRQAIAARMTQSKQTVPHFYVRGSVRAGALVSLRALINESSQVRVSLNDLIVKAVALAHLSVPEMNVIWIPEAIRSFETVDVAIAVATDGGLFTPVVREADTASVTTIARSSGELAERARRGELKQHEIEGGTITVTNLGMYGTEEFTAIINPPQAAILAVGAVRQEPVVDDDGAVVAAPLMRLTLSVDHRPVDGVTAARWMRALIEVLEAPLKLLL